MLRDVMGLNSVRELRSSRADESELLTLPCFISGET